MSRKKYNLNKEVLLNEDNNSFYLLGAYMTDGHISNTKRKKFFKLSSIDGDWLISIKNILSPEKPLYTSKFDKSLVLHLNDIDCVNWLISYGCTPKKSLTLNLTKNIPNSFHKDFIRGVFDGDGSVSYCRYKKVKNNKEYFYFKKTIYICSASYDFILTLRDMLPPDIKNHIITITAEKHNYYKYKIKAKNDIYRLVMNESNAVKFSKWIYENNPNLYLPRKYKKCMELISL